MQLSTWKYIWSSALALLVIVAAEAQKKEKDPADSARGIHPPTGIRIGTDLIALGKTVAGTSLTGWEINADVDVGRYYLAADFGGWSRKETLTNGAYENQGRYWRAGIDVNFLLKDPDRNMFFIGFRYGRSSFSERVEFVGQTTDYGVYQKAASNPNATAGWAELTTGLRVKIIGGLWMGYTGRMKFLPGVRGDDGFASYDIPGYGLAAKDLYWGFNYQVFWRFPIRSQR